MFLYHFTHKDITRIHTAFGQNVHVSFFLVFLICPLTSKCIRETHNLFYFTKVSLHQCRIFRYRYTMIFWYPNILIYGSGSIFNNIYKQGYILRNSSIRMIYYASSEMFNIKYFSYVYVLIMSHLSSFVNDRILVTLFKYI